MVDDAAHESSGGYRESERTRGIAGGDRGFPPPRGAVLAVLKALEAALAGGATEAEVDRFLELLAGRGRAARESE